MKNCEKCKGSDYSPEACVKCKDDYINQLINENQRYESIIHEYEAQENVLEDELDDAQRECTRLITENQELESELDVAKENLKISVKYSKGLESDLYDCNTMVQQLEQKLETLKRKRAAFDNHSSDVIKELRKQLEEQKELVEIGMMWEWYYTECKNFYAITGGKLSKKERYQMLKKRVMEDFREQKGQ